VHYDDDTTLYFTDFYWALWYPPIETALLDRICVPRWVRNIKRMALPDYHLVQHRFTGFRTRYPQLKNGVFSLLPAFSSLQKLYAVITIITRSALDAGEVDWTKGLLRECLALLACTEAWWQLPHFQILQRQLRDGREFGVRTIDIYP